jgi:hypothetical protein
MSSASSNEGPPQMSSHIISQTGDADVCGPDHDCLALAIMDMAAHMGIDYRTNREYHLLAIAHKALKAPLPAPWTSEVDEDGILLYVDTETNERTLQRPFNLGHYEALIARTRLKHKAAVENVEVSPWMKLTEQDQSVYFYNFETHERANMLPAGIAGHGASATRISVMGMNRHHDDALLSGNGAIGPGGSSVAMSKGGLAAGSLAGSRAGGTLRHQQQKPPAALRILTLEKMKFTSWWVMIYECSFVTPLTFRRSLTHANNILTMNRHATTTDYRWTENRVKHYIHITYNLLTEEFRVRIDKDETTYVLKSVEGKLGPVDCWDLHVRATINVLGRNVTLMQCNSGTSRWLQAQVKRLRTARQALVDILSKYEVVAGANKNKNVPPTEVHLRALKNECTRLKQRVNFYRPKIAAGFHI